MTIDGVSKILLGNPDQTRPDEDCRGDPVVELEHDVVDGQVIDLDDGLGGAEDVQGHDTTLALSSDEIKLRPVITS